MSVNATLVPQSPDLVALLTLIGTWALVAVASLTVYVTARQTRKGQELMSKQVEESIAQTKLQQEQFAQSLDERERPRIVELIRKVLTTAIRLIDGNNQTRSETFLVEGNIVHNYLVGSSDDATRLAFDGFKREYPELAAKIKAYDEISIDIRNTRQKLHDVLVASVREVLPSILKETSLPPEWRVGEKGFPSVDVEEIVTNGIFPEIVGKDPTVRYLESFLWEKADQLKELTKKPESKSLIDELRGLAQRSLDTGTKLSAELGELREHLGSKYKIPWRDYFPSVPPAIVLTS